MSAMTMHARIILAIACLAPLCGCTKPRWQDTLASRLPEFGHRNWIVVADSAYPKQSAPGIETVCTGEQQLNVLRQVLKAVEGMPHVRPVVLLDAELARVAESDAPGVEAYRSKLNALLEGREVRVMPHEEIIAKLDDGSKLFNVLLLKTNLTIPYTSVFLELDCGYWDPEKEARLRAALAH